MKEQQWHLADEMKTTLFDNKGEVYGHSVVVNVLAVWY